MAKMILELRSADHEGSHLDICEKSIQAEGKSKKTQLPRIRYMPGMIKKISSQLMWNQSKKLGF